MEIIKPPPSNLIVQGILRLCFPVEALPTEIIAYLAPAINSSSGPQMT
jgi:hypothetical protein